MEDLEIMLVRNLARECGYKELEVSDMKVQIFGGFKEPELFRNLDDCRRFLFNEKRRHEELVKANRESYLRIRQRK